jgi:murein DD-endopeptidase MepM/ murein hydrolase activator NlpD
MTIMTGSPYHKYYPGVYEDDRYAIDVNDRCRRGIPVAAPFAGSVVRSTSTARGRQVIIKADGAGLYVGLAHLDSIAGGAFLGAHVSRGQVVGSVGNSGPYAGSCPHIHMGVWSGTRSGAGVPIRQLSGQAVYGGARIVGQ